MLPSKAVGRTVQGLKCGESVSQLVFPFPRHMVGKEVLSWVTWSTSQAFSMLAAVHRVHVATHHKERRLRPWSLWCLTACVEPCVEIKFASDLQTWFMDIKWIPQFSGL